MDIKNAPDHVIVSVDLEKKNSHTFQDGTTIRLERQYNNLNRRETEPVNAIVVASDYLPIGAEVIIHHNACHDTYRLFDYGKLSGNYESSSIKYFSILERDCFMYREKDSEDWLPCRNFETALRVFEPYEGPLQGISPKKLKDKLLITSGNMKGKVVLTLKACDYEMIFQGLNGREQRIIRVRHFDTESPHERQEIIAIDEISTYLVNCGKLLVGLTETDCKIYQNA